LLALIRDAVADLPDEIAAKIDAVLGGLKVRGRGQ
jgi:hypothetical protein